MFPGIGCDDVSADPAATHGERGAVVGDIAAVIVCDPRSPHDVMRTFACLTIAALTVACSRPPAQNRDDAERALRSADEQLQQAVAQRDLERIMSFYSEDAILLPAAKKLISGKAAIRDEWASILTIPGFANQSQLTSLEIARAGDMAYTTGTYLSDLIGEDGKPVKEPGKWLTVWKRQPDGAWRITVDTYNTDVPPPDHK